MVTFSVCTSRQTRILTLALSVCVFALIAMGNIIPHFLPKCKVLQIVFQIYLFLSEKGQIANCFLFSFPLLFSIRE